MSRVNKGHRKMTFHLRDGGLLARLLEEYRQQHEMSVNRALYTLLMEGLIDYMRSREGDDPALYDMLYSEWLGTLSREGERPSLDEFIDWLVAREMPPAGGRRPGAGRKAKELQST